MSPMISLGVTFFHHSSCASASRRFTLTKTGSGRSCVPSRRRCRALYHSNSQTFSVRISTGLGPRLPIISSVYKLVPIHANQRHSRVDGGEVKRKLLP